MTALLPGDCPLLDPVELDSSARGIRGGCVGVATDRHGTGTNGLFLAPADAIGPAFGPGSRERHLDRARRAGYEAEELDIPSLALDLDTPDDLDALVSLLAETRSRTPDRGRARRAVIEVRPVEGIPEVEEGAPLGLMIATAAELRDGDIVVISQKIVSKAEGRVRDLATVEPSSSAASWPPRSERTRAWSS